MLKYPTDLFYYISVNFASPFLYNFCKIREVILAVSEKRCAGWIFYMRAEQAPPLRACWYYFFSVVTRIYCIPAARRITDSIISASESISAAFSGSPSRKRSVISA